MTVGKRIVLTGAAGLAGRGVRPLLHERGHDLVLVDLVDPGAAPGEAVVLASVTDTAQMRAAVRGADIVVHLGGLSREAAWTDIVSANIDGTRSVLEACRHEGVRNVLLASSTHAVGFHPVPSTPVADLEPRPDSYYGVSKVAMEALGAVYADRYGMSIVTVRIGTILERPENGRSLSTWLSFPDTARLIEAVAAVEEPGAHLIWGVSHNTRGWFDLGAGQAIGYYPEDDAEEYSADIDDSAVGSLIGGAIADLDYELGVPW